MIQLFFTPASASIGGLILGICVSGVFLLRGGILGCSSHIRTIAKLEFSPWPLASLFGLLAGSGIVVSLLPSAFDAYPDSFTLGRVAASGILVGLGTSLGNGCTSGHGLCGISRLSIRSIIYTCIFMLAAGLTANLTKVEDSLGVVNVLGGGVPLTQSIGGYQLAMGLGTAAALVLIFGLLFLAGTKIKPGTNSQGDQPLAASFVQVKPALAGEEKTSSLFVTLDKLKEVGSWHLALLGLAVEFVAGFAFAIGLGIGGMTQNSKVVGFLSVAFTWDPSLAFVMGVGCLVALPSYQLVLWMKALDAPACARKFDLPANKTWRDLRLLTGGVLFGVGWGLSGYCPGPAIVNLVRLTPQSAVFNGCMLGGAVLEALGTYVWTEWKAGSKASVIASQDV